MRRAIIILSVLALVGQANATTAATAASDGVSSADKPPSPGLSFFANADAFWADNGTANFYSGIPVNENTINRVLYSNTYGMQIWQNLYNQGLISDAVGTYNQLQVIEYPNMYYRISYQFGLGMRYDYSSGFGWLLRFNIAKLQATGAFNLSTDNGTGILGDDQYIRCGMLGKEDRISIDLALTRKVQVGANTEVELDLGASLINTKVKDNIMEIGGATYSILDVWDHQTPDVGVESYEYINQGGIGYGFFATISAGYNISEIGAIRLCYTCSQAYTNLTDYESWGWHHMLGVRVEMNNFGKQ